MDLLVFTGIGGGFLVTAGVAAGWHWLDPRSVQVATGFAGIAGGLLLAAIWFIPAIQPTDATLVGFGLLYLSDVGLLLVMARAIPLWGLVWGLLAAFLLGATGAVGVLGFWGFSTGGGIGAIPIMAFGLGGLFLAAPALALACAWARVLPWAPAVVFLVADVCWCFRKPDSRPGRRHPIRGLGLVGPRDPARVGAHRERCYPAGLRRLNHAPNTGGQSVPPARRSATDP
jgi:hypothetical protein